MLLYFTQRNLECPMSSSVELCAKIDDKVWTTYIMAEVGMNFPEFLAFRYRPKNSIPFVRDERIQLCTIEEKSDGYDVIAEEVETFLDQSFMENIGKVNCSSYTFLTLPSFLDQTLFQKIPMTIAF